MNPNEKPHWPTVIGTLALLIAAFAAVGTGDYADALEHENAALRAAATRCQLAQALHEEAAPETTRPDGGQ